MQHYPGGLSSQARKQPGQRTQGGRGKRTTQRTQPMLPGAMRPTAPLTAPAVSDTPRPGRKPAQPHYGLRAAWKLAVLGLLLEVIYLALYPLFAAVPAARSGALQAFSGLFPWLPRLYWTNAFPALSSALAHLPRPGLTVGNAGLLLALLVLALLVVLLAWRVGRRVLRNRLSRVETGSLFWLLFLATALFSLTFLFAPPVQVQNLFLYGMYGRMVAIYHVNPYVVSPSAFPHDLLYPLLPVSARGSVALAGPVWLDISIPLALFAHGDAGSMVIAFRLLGLVAHLMNTLLIWAILAKVKPETRIAATLLYGWNPLALLFAIASMQQEVGIVLFLLLAVFFFQRKSLLLGWVFLLLAALINPLCLFLLPLFLRLLHYETRLLPRGRRWLWWFGCLSISALVIVLAYAPFWYGWGWDGLVAMLAQTFWPVGAVNSLDAALINLPVRPLSAFAWLFAPHHWILFAAISVALLVLLGVWLIDSLQLTLLFSSWLFLALFIFFPVSWPWLLLPPLVLALCAASGRTLLLAVLLLFGALFSFYYDFSQPAWQGQALLTIGVPVLLWGWLLFFTSTWHMTRAGEEQEETQQSAVAGRKPTRTKGFSRPIWQGWASRPSWPGRRQQN